MSGRTVARSRLSPPKSEAVARWARRPVGLADGVGPALFEEAGVSGATLGLDRGIIIPRGCRVDIQFRRRHVEIAGKDDGDILA